MALTGSPPSVISASSDAADKSPVVASLTRGTYKRLPEIERQIADAVSLDALMLVQRARQRDESAPIFLSPEALVYFIRQAIRNGDVRTRDDLIRELLERCNPYFGGKFRGFGREDREDLQGEVQRTMIEDLFAEDDRSDFMQVRFWKYLERKCIDACRATLRSKKNLESLETGYSGEGVPEGRTRLEQLVDHRLSPEQLATISRGLEQLPTRLQHVFVLRHYVGMNIGSDNPSKDGGDRLTIATAFGRSGRTIRSWLKEADRLLAEFQENDDGE